MKTVLPIRDIKKISQIKNMLKGGNKIRDLLLFELGINSALRISDLLSVKIKQVFDEEGKTKDSFDIVEKKTKKVHRVTVTNKVKQTLELYYHTYSYVVQNQNYYLFFHQKSFPIGIKPITRKTGWLLIDQRCRDVGLVGNYGGHSLRKSWGYHARVNGVSLELIMYKLNHSSISMTKKYLGITDDEIQEACNKLDL